VSIVFSYHLIQNIMWNFLFELNQLHGKTKYTQKLAPVTYFSIL